MIQPENMHLAQVNVANAIDDLESARLADFVGALDRVNAVAERSPGFVWRLKDDTGNATDIPASGRPALDRQSLGLGEPGASGTVSLEHHPQAGLSEAVEVVRSPEDGALRHVVGAHRARADRGGRPSSGWKN